MPPALDRRQHPRLVLQPPGRDRRRLLHRVLVHDAVGVAVHPDPAGVHVRPPPVEPFEHRVRRRPIHLAHSARTKPPDAVRRPPRLLHPAVRRRPSTHRRPPWPQALVTASTARSLRANAVTSCPCRSSVSITTRADVAGTTGQEHLHAFSFARSPLCCSSAPDFQDLFGPPVIPLRYGRALVVAARRHGPVHRGGGDPAAARAAGIAGGGRRVGGPAAGAAGGGDGVVRGACVRRRLGDAAEGGVQEVPGGGVPPVGPRGVRGGVDRGDGRRCGRSR